MNMKMMKELKLVLVLVLILNGLIWVYADSLHQDIYIVGCSDTVGEDMYGLDGEEVVYVDFKNKKEVDVQPDFVDHVQYPGEYEHAVANLQVCKYNLGIARTAMKDIPLIKVSPSAVIIYPKHELSLGEDNTLICHVSGFYPAPVTITWTHNEHNITSSSVNVPFPNSDGTFTQISRLDFTPKQGDIYGCSVHHPARTQPLTTLWDVDVPQPSVGPSVFCGVGLTLGLLGVATGTFFLIKGNECS